MFQNKLCVKESGFCKCYMVSLGPKRLKDFGRNLAGVLQGGMASTLCTFDC
ncbi:hypothetical protein HanXRQr2_Chr01g0040971 [Helianthus annuus]|uniref:Uncharacterized protein n=1 Tax=Helianthus annuus TaxID=4232 RepID=A0A251UB53_HELAN|nr:hypothetical protein HanXRQr2_Chr01g0040971 [Helianthus annuus]KAJ0958511.1 hypothetical protein HanPSC8_Chr01g0039781 [Helianthus annuus]